MTREWDCCDAPEVQCIKKLYELRHCCNVFDFSYVSSELGVDVEDLKLLYSSEVNGDVKFRKFFQSEDLEEMIEEHTENNLQAIHKNDRLIEDLSRRRTNFAGIGTNKVKRRLNKLAKTNTVAKAVRLALEAEDKNISAKNSYGNYIEKIYKDKNKFIWQLVELFDQEGWVYGVQRSKVPPASHVIYFEIPGTEQISWHYTVPDKKKLPVYAGYWDRKVNSTLGKLEKITNRLLGDVK